MSRMSTTPFKVRIFFIKVAKGDHQEGVDHRQDKNWEMQPIWELSTKGQFSENEIHWIARIPDTGWLSY